ncbi:MAG: V-type ATP synthase subunit I [Erysipelotrichaceae bacterium]|nr:V-type ATP synthase subunit I [Erysipelotrichaceae bacterium]
MAIAKMKLVNITSDRAKLDEVLLRFVELDCFHPEPATKIAESVHGVTTLQEEDPYCELLSRLKDLEVNLGLSLNNEFIKDWKCDLNEMSTYMEQLERKREEIEEVKRELEGVIQANKDALTQVENIEGMDVSLDDIFSCKYVNVRFGRLPLDSVDKLQYYGNRPFVFRSFKEDSSYSWCMVLSTPKYEREVDNILSSLYFERIRIPDFVHDTPEKAEENLKAEIESDYQQLASIEKERDDMIQACQQRLQVIKGRLLFLENTFEARKYVVGLGERFTITGFAASDDVKKIEAVFADIKDVEIAARPAYSDRRFTPPTKLKNSWFTRPFSMFVEMYGLPNYEDIDPTPFVALTYTLLFGIMFGDVGQGLVLILVGWLAAKLKHMKLGEIGIRIGISSTLFGFVYGSVFGDEHLLDPLYQSLFHLEEKPIEVMGSDFIMPLLICAIAIGAVLIVLSMSINMYIQIKHKNWCELLLSQNGIAGIVFYIAFLGGAAAQFGFGIAVFSKLYILALIVLPLLLIFLKEPIEHKVKGKPMFPDGFGGFFTQSFFELFEVCLSFITNTISYLRVGGFVLSHAGMMLVVTLLMEMVSGAGSIAVAIFGNLFVMCLEGMIVGIQVLRLEFYEMFSRYFSGDGIAFQSLKNME